MPGFLRAKEVFRTKRIGITIARLGPHAKRIMIPVDHVLDVIGRPHSDQRLEIIPVKVNTKTKVPQEHIKDGEITLNISHTAANNLEIGNEFIIFKARFDGSSRNIQIPINTVKGIYAKEINQGLSFAIANTMAEDGNDPELLPIDPMVPPSIIRVIISIMSDIILIIGALSAV